MFLNIRFTIIQFIDDKSISATIVSDFLLGVGRAVIALVTVTRLWVVGDGGFIPFIRRLVGLTT